VRFDRAAARSLYFSHLDGTLPGRLRRRVAQAVVLIGSEHRRALEDAYVRVVRPFPYDLEGQAVDALRKALEVTCGSRGTPARARTAAGT
jgi:hypothetical protein